MKGCFIIICNELVKYFCLKKNLVQKGLKVKYPLSDQHFWEDNQKLQAQLMCR